MTDQDDKIVRLNTGYSPDPATDNDDLNWTLTLLKDEIEQLSRTISTLTKGLRVLSNKMHEIHKHIKKQD